MTVLKHQWLRLYLNTGDHDCIETPVTMTVFKHQWLPHVLKAEILALCIAASFLCFFLLFLIFFLFHLKQKWPTLSVLYWWYFGCVYSCFTAECKQVMVMMMMFMMVPLPGCRLDCVYATVISLLTVFKRWRWLYTISFSRLVSLLVWWACCQVMDPPPAPLWPTTQKSTRWPSPDPQRSVVDSSD